ncbi:MAG: hypothetical protein GY820_07440 [Gammaproteobacteria bacterium]|nr:hypothetical protein [Gammaproteobacteria bacterium]
MAEGLECVEECLERRPRSCSVARENQDRGEAGEFVTTFLPRRRRDATAGSLEDYIRLTVDQFDFLLDRVRSKLEKQNTAASPICPEQRLAITLRSNLYLF